MSSINFHKKKNGKVVYRLRFKVDGRICRVSVGSTLPQKVKTKLLHLIDRLEAHNASGTVLDADLMEELHGLDDGLQKKLVASGLLSGDSAPSLKDFLDGYISQRTGLSDLTIWKMRNSAKLFVQFFGDVTLTRISAGDVEDYLEYRKSLGRSAATCGAEIKHGKQFFAYAMKKKFVSENPFQDFKVGAQADMKRNRILDGTMLEKIIDAAPTLEWKALIAICRWTGCRRGEVLALKWADILWDENKIRMPSPKTAHMGKPTRLIPLFPELYPVLAEWFEASSDGAEYVISSLVNGTNRSGPRVRNIGKSFSHIIRNAGFDPWPKPLQNLRSTRENELERQFPSHVVQAWIGHNRKTAETHYLRVSDDDFDQAVTGWSNSGQQGPADPRSDPSEKRRRIEKGTIQGPAQHCRDSDRASFTRPGLERIMATHPATCS
jgi:integrase